MQGRHLFPVNFNKEIYLEVNLGPTYRSEPLVKEVYELRKKEYLFKEDEYGRIVNAHTVTDVNFGSAITTFRRNQDQKSRFPTVFWQ